MTEDGILNRIDELIAEEHALRARAAGTGLSAVDRDRLTALEQRLDQCWDLLRRRRARTEFAEDPDETEVRSVAQVEGYRQ
ncbi:DUF2630 family protein [Amycolatopsis panacis]|uniref:DUF2630 family protein n=1 Tax=Amycolatopsis panacis TaxID=2340917 RepID=A0A419I4C6_9PSEU|nr:DUF2630 family protein [Amycolatopsis panacis]RJQ85244.1 DUF2630 family protein [Amycolatopsis panacis]